jgi:hypothetical protein
LGGSPGFPVDVHIFNPLETMAHLEAGVFSREVVEQVEMGAEFLPRARREEHACILCRRPFVGLPARIAWLETPGGTKRALFGVCKACDGPDVEQRLIERLGAREKVIN